MTKPLLSLAAALLAGLAGAVTVDWTPASGAQTNLLGGFDPDVTITLSVTYTITESPNTTGPNGNLFAISWGAGNPADATADSLIVRNITAHDGPNAVINATSSRGSEPDAYYRNVIAGAFDTTNGGQHTLTFTLDLGDSPAISVTLDGGDAQTLTLPNNSLDPESLKLWTYNQSWGSVSSVSVDYWAVPEPTALALLALGVAGLALRRKTA